MLEDTNRKSSSIKRLSSSIWTNGTTAALPLVRILFIYYQFIYFQKNYTTMQGRPKVKFYIFW
jgi:hypothetical protein